MKLLGTVNVCNPSSIHPVVIKIFHLNPSKENFSLLWVLDQITTVSWIHPLVTMAVCTKFHGPPSHSRRTNDPGRCCHTSQQSSPEMASHFRRHDFRQQQAGSPLEASTYLSSPIDSSTAFVLPPAKPESLWLTQSFLLLLQASHQAQTHAIRAK